ncbi:MAG TPA: metallophosphoesterase family protein [Chitinophagaceae bacterium]|nr:metallophosphoesterase family protein [Chitinophagaceae bacterium]
MKTIFFTILLILYNVFCEGQIIIRGPYLTMANQSSVTITWRTDIACKSKVNYGGSLGLYSGGVVDNNIVTEHVIKLVGLLPDTKYFYTVGTNTSILQSNADNYFKTLPISSKTYNKPIRILAVGDVAKATVNEEQVRDAFLNYIDTNYIDGYLMLGDNAYPNGEDWEFQNGFFNYFQNTITKNTVLWPALGNHEYANDYNLRKSHAISYFDIFTLPKNGECGGLASQTEMYYSFNIGNIHFINLDSYGLEELGGNYYGIADTLISPQINWLKADLDANTLPWVIVSFHHAPYCMGTHNSDLEQDLVDIRQNLNPILERYNVDLVLTGHCHSYQRSAMIHQHFGMEASFDSSSHLVQKTSGYNDGSAFSCPIIKNSQPALASDSGLIYMVIGSGSAYPQSPQTQWPHNAMYYSNYLDNGSLLLTIQDNQLLGEWVSTDTNQIVKDHFTIYKNVNRRNHLSVASGQPTTLKASWLKTNDYIWSTGDSTQTITVSPTSYTQYWVSDKMGCIRDSFFITMAAPNTLVETAEQQIDISPNPVNDQLKIEGLEIGHYDINLIHSDGAKFLNKRISITKPNEIYFLSVKEAASGQYILQLIVDSRIVSSHRIQISH